MNYVSQDRMELGEALAKIAAAPPEDRSLTIGITGLRGSGKTSLVMMAFHAARKLGIPEKQLIHFSALAVDPANHVEAFFRELGRGLDLVAGKGTVQMLGRYAEALAGAGKLSERVLAAANRLITVLSLVGIGSVAFLDSRVAQIALLGGSIALHVLGPILLGTSKVLEWTERAVRRWRSSRHTIKRLRKRIAKKLCRIKHPIIIAIDDIDGLQPEAAEKILRLTQDNAHLPNLTYIVVMRSQTNRHAKESKRRAPPHRFVNILVDIPPVTRDAFDAGSEE